MIWGTKEDLGQLLMASCIFNLLEYNSYFKANFQK